jgi:hypothetical protein
MATGMKASPGFPRRAGLFVLVSRAISNRVDPAVIASEAKQSMRQRESKSGLLRRFAPRNDAAPILNTLPRSRRAFSREFCSDVSPSSIGGRSAPQEGSGECRTLDASAAACAMVESTRVSHHGHAANTRHSPRNGFNGLLRALPGDRAFLPPSPVKITSHRLDASVGASGPHGFAVRAPCHSSFDVAHVHHIPPRVRDDREPPLQWDETARYMHVIWVRRESEYFCGGDSTR